MEVAQIRIRNIRYSYELCSYHKKQTLLFAFVAKV